MSRLVRPRAPVIALLAITACAEEPPTAVAFLEPAGPIEFTLSLPDVSQADLVYIDTTRTEQPAGPSRVEGEPGEGSEGSPEDYLDDVATIYNPRTLVGIVPGFAYAWGEHSYQGNKGRVETTADVSYQGTPLGEQTAARERAGLFLVDGPQVKYISVMAKVFSDRECGLSVTGSTQHSAWWEWFLGMGVPSWGLAETPSEAGPKSQAECAGEGGPGGSPPDGSNPVCYVSITYDRETGEIVSQELLFCTGLNEQQGG